MSNEPDMRSDERGREVIAMIDAERFEAIGRAVVRHIKGDDERAAHQATAEGVVAHLTRADVELRSYMTCDALRVGRLAIMLVEALGINTKGA